MAEAPRSARRCMCNCNPRAWLTNMDPNSAIALKSWPPLGSAVERKSKHSTAEGASPHSLLFLYLLGHHFCTNFLAVPMLWLFRQQVLPERPRMLKSCCSGPNADLYGSFYQFCQSLLRYRLHIHVRFRGYVQCLAVGVRANASLALDAILCLCTAMVLKTRTEKERYRYIDEEIRPVGFRLDRSRV